MIYSEKTYAALALDPFNMANVIETGETFGLVATDIGTEREVNPGQTVEFMREGTPGRIGVGEVWFALERVCSVRIIDGEIEDGDVAYFFEG